MGNAKFNCIKETDSQDSNNISSFTNAVYAKSANLESLRLDTPQLNNEQRNIEISEIGDSEYASLPLSEKMRLCERSSIDLLNKSYEQLAELSTLRLACKLSASRVSGVAREVRELIKVMSTLRDGNINTD